jgi:hypothetical protein
MSELPMRGHFRYLRFKTFPMTPRTPQYEVFFPLLSSSEHSGVPEDSNSQLFQVLGFTPTLGQSGVATLILCFLFAPAFTTVEISFFVLKSTVACASLLFWSNDLGCFADGIPLEGARNDVNI